MEISKNFDFRTAEARWYQHWNEQGFFNSVPDDREPYTIVIPPPNVTGILHMGHCLNNTIQDILIRRARMHGKNACWVGGTDHASIATEAKVVHMLREKGIAKSSLTREEFIAYAWEWKEKYGGIILSQLKKLGCSIDWNRTAFTMDPDYSRSVIQVFNDLYEKGYIYRGKRMINWDPRAKTALSDEEVIYKEVQSKLYFIRYRVEDKNGNLLPEDQGITIATVRPETILGDTAIAVNPSDERYTHLHGAFAFVPLINRKIPIITDDYVTTDFGTGALKVTPAHDMNDYALGEKHKLEVVDILEEDGRLNADAKLYVGTDRFEARKLIVKDLEAAGQLMKIQDYTNQIGFSERTDVVVEPRLSLQWWVAMKKINGPALEAVLQDDIKFYPSKFKNLYRHWMENIHDWCISRQLWWGHRIPAWFDAEGRFVVAMDEKEAYEKYTAKFGVSSPSLTQDEACLDTWFSSWLWPFEVFHGLSDPGNKDVKYYYPTNTLVTAPEIIFFWVARMIMAGFEYMGEKPFSEVYFTGIVRDNQGRKMSKQLGNSPDLLQMIDDIGADAVRFGILIASPAGNDLLWDPASNEQGRHFINKIWNALKLIKIWQEKAATSQQVSTEENSWPQDWFRARLNQVRAEVDQLMAQFKLSEALKTIYSLVWDDYCSWYLEWIKPAPDTAMLPKTIDRAIGYFEELLEILHPFLPFVTEEIYQLLRERSSSDSLCVRQVKPVTESGSELNGLSQDQWLREGDLLKASISAIRDARNKAQLKPKDTIELYYQGEEQDTINRFSGILSRQVNAVAQPQTVKEAVEGSVHVVAGKDRFFMVCESPVDSSAQQKELHKELEYLRGFLESVNKKLGNGKFTANAKPEVVELERRKKEDAEEKIKILEQSLKGIAGKA
ncbi:valine--tRNA ligase [Pollutibacter soli]|uniref:valine--tRNA ligase n=1 Tax=Pollutibacter soli TaxID=3034157 RepID=UPI0030140B17